MGTVCGWNYLGKGARVFDPVVVLKPEMVTVGDYARIDSFVKIEGGEHGVWIGEHVHIASFSHINGGGGGVYFGAHSGCGSGVKIVGGMPDINYLHISAAEPPDLCHVVRKRTMIGQYVVIFTNAVICPGVTIGDGAIIGAGAVVTHDVPPWEVWAGNPARKIGAREASERGMADSEHQL